MTDIVERLREWATHYHRKEAAAEIERLRARNERWNQQLVDMNEQITDQQNEIERLRTHNAELLAALEELLSGHDNLYVAHWHYLPDCNPLDDIAAKAARAAIEKAKV